MTDKTNQPAGAAAVVTEEDLLKSIKELEAKPEPAKEAAATPEVKTEGLAKSAAAAVKEGASDELKKSLDVSAALTEIVGLLGTHVDTSLEALAKSVQSGAERDLAIVRVLGDLKKSVDNLAETVKTFGDQPGTPASKQAPAAAATDVLHKTAGGGQQQKAEVDPAKVRREISNGLERLAKSVQAGSPEADRYIKAAIQFESTGKIEDGMLAEVKKLYAPKA